MQTLSKSSIKKIVVFTSLVSLFTLSGCSFFESNNQEKQMNNTGNNQKNTEAEQNNESGETNTGQSENNLESNNQNGDNQNAQETSFDTVNEKFNERIFLSNLNMTEEFLKSIDVENLKNKGNYKFNISMGKYGKIDLNMDITSLYKYGETNIKNSDFKLDLNIEGNAMFTKEFYIKQMGRNTTKEITENIEGEDVKGNLNAKISIKKVDEKIYVKLSSVNIDLNTKDIPKINQQMTMINSMIKGYSGRWFSLNTESVDYNSKDINSDKIFNYISNLKKSFRDNNILKQESKKTDGNKIIYNVKSNKDGIKNIYKVVKNIKGESSNINNISNQFNNTGNKTLGQLIYNKESDIVSLNFNVEDKKEIDKMIIKAGQNKNTLFIKGNNIDGEYDTMSMQLNQQFSNDNQNSKFIFGFNGKHPTKSFSLKGKINLLNGEKTSLEGSISIKPKFEGSEVEKIDSMGLEFKQEWSGVNNINIEMPKNAQSLQKMFGQMMGGGKTMGGGMQNGQGNMNNRINR